MRRWLQLLVMWGLVAGAPAIWGASAEAYAKHVAGLIDPAKLATLGERGADVVLELEVNGVLTGATVRLAAGVANQEAVTTGSLNVDVPAGRGVRWKVTSAPDAEFTAWGCGLAMEVRAA